MVIGLIVLGIMIILYLLGYVSLWSILGAILLSIGSFGVLISDGKKKRLHRAGFIVISIFGIILIVLGILY